MIPWCRGENDAAALGQNSRAVADRNFWSDGLLQWQSAIVDRLDGAAWPGGSPGDHCFMNRHLVLLPQGEAPRWRRSVLHAVLAKWHSDDDSTTGTGKMGSNRRVEDLDGLRSSWWRSLTTEWNSWAPQWHRLEASCGQGNTSKGTTRQQVDELRSGVEKLVAALRCPDGDWI